MSEYRKHTKIIALVALAGAVVLFAFLFSAPEAGADHADPFYKVEASNATLNRELMGDTERYVQGVPAAPVDSFTWDGQNRSPVWDAEVEVEINPTDNTGTIRAEWKDRNGEWEFVQNSFHPPHHPSGIRLTSRSTTAFVEDDPVPVNVYLHGDTTAGGPVLPAIFNYVATWGPAEVTLNGEPFANPYDDGSPAPAWIAHTMTTEGVRNPDGSVTVNGGSIYNPTLRDQPGDINPNDLEFHLVFHDAPNPENPTGNIPGPFAFFYHLTFEDVKFEIQ